MSEEVHICIAIYDGERVIVFINGERESNYDHGLIDFDFGIQELTELANGSTCKLEILSHELNEWQIERLEAVQTRNDFMDLIRS